MKEMNSKERIDAVLNHQPVDRTPFAVVDGGTWITTMKGISYNELYSMEDSGASEIVKYLNEIESDTISSVSGVFTACLNAFGSPIELEKIGASVNTGAAFTDPEKEIPLLDKNTIREKLLANDFVQKMLNQCRNVKALVGDSKYLIGDIAGPFTMAGVLIGTGEFMTLLVKNPALVKQLIDFTIGISTEMFTLLHENGCDIAFVAEPVSSGSMISPIMFKKWAIPALSQLKNNLSFYKYFYTHICGASGNRIPALRACGVTAFSGDYLVDLDKALIDAEDKITIMGNINPAGILMTGTPEEVYEEACERIRIANGRSHILAPGCDLGSMTPIENVKMLVKACKDLAN